MIKKILISAVGLAGLMLGQFCVSQTNDPTSNTEQMLAQVKQLQQQQGSQPSNAAPQQTMLLAQQAIPAPLPPPPLPAQPIVAQPVAAPLPPPLPAPAPQPVLVPAPVAASQNPNLQGQLYSNVTTQQQMVSSSYASPVYNQAFKAPFASVQIPQTPLQQSISQGAFASMVQGTLPMTPEQIHRLRQLYSASQYAAAAPAGVPPRPTATSLFVDLSPGATPPAINLSEGDITALVFLDATGAPWPIAAIDNGNPSAFNIEWNKKDNVLMIQATSSFGTGNLAIRLQQLGPPVMISLVTNTAVENGGVVDYRVDMRVPGYGPFAKPPPVSGLPDANSPEMLDVLDGIPPTGSQALIVADNVGQAWRLGDKIYLRTRLTLLSPGWIQTMASADGTNAYQLQATPLLLMSQNGKVIQVKVQGL